MPNHNLKPCPFRGDKHATYDYEDRGCESWVYCQRCRARGPTYDHANHAQIAEAWNTRTGERKDVSDGTE